MLGATEMSNGVAQGAFLLAFSCGTKSHGACDQSRDPKTLFARVEVLMLGS